MIASLLYALKLAAYVPSLDAPLGGWFFIGTNIKPIEIGFTMEPERVRYNFLGREAHKTEFEPVGFVGIRHAVNADVDVSVGGKIAKEAFPYFSASFKFSTLKH